MNVLLLLVEGNFLSGRGVAYILHIHMEEGAVLLERKGNWYTISLPMVYQFSKGQKLCNTDRSQINELVLINIY